MKTTAMEMTKLEQWTAEWQAVYKDELEGILSNEKLDAEMKKAGSNFLKNIDKYMVSVLVDLSKFRHIFDTMNAEFIMLKGINNLVSSDYSYERFYANGDCAIIKRFDDNNYIHFLPFVLEEMMMTEFCGSTDYDNGEPYFSLNIRIYEDDPIRIDFDLEYQDLEDLARRKKQQSILKNFKNRLSEPINHEIFVDDVEDFENDDEDMEADEEMLKSLTMVKYQKLKDSFEDVKEVLVSVELFRIEKNGEAVWHIQIIDETGSLTTIILDKKGWKIHWGSNTPIRLKMVIQNAMNE